VRACDEVQGTFALTIEGRGFESRVVASQDDPFLESECVSCGACVESCPTAALSEKSLAVVGRPERAVTTTCAYCGVGCSFEAEVKGEEVVRMVPTATARRIAATRASRDGSRTATPPMPTESRRR
jgi:formate dehydrogenase major subunit